MQNTNLLWVAILACSCANTNAASDSAEDKRADQSASPGSRQNATVPAADKTVPDGDNKELQVLYNEDQADRLGEEVDWSVVGPRDERRQKRIYELLAAEKLQTAKDHFHAAMVLQHGRSESDFLKAHELAKQAIRLDPTFANAKWLAAATIDRYHMMRDEPQKYGTQFRTVDGKWELYKVDPSVTDAECASWNVPSLAEAQARAREMNATQ